MTEDLKKYKLYFLQLKYTRIINIIHNVENHYMVLKQLNLLNGDKIIDFSNKIYNIVKNVNTIYNQYVNNYFNSYTEIDKLINSILNLSNTEILKILDYYESDISFNLFNDTIKHFYIEFKNDLEVDIIEQEDHIYMKGIENLK